MVKVIVLEDIVSTFDLNSYIICVIISDLETIDDHIIRPNYESLYHRRPLSLKSYWRPGRSRSGSINPFAVASCRDINSISRNRNIRRFLNSFEWGGRCPRVGIIAGHRHVVRTYSSRWQCLSIRFISRQ